MTTKMKLVLIGVALIPFAWVNAQISDSVSTYQLNAAYHCSNSGTVCRGNGFGYVRIIE